MKSTEIKTKVQNLIDKFSEEEFIYDLLITYGISKTLNSTKSPDFTELN